MKKERPNKKLLSLYKYRSLQKKKGKAIEQSKDKAGDSCSGKAVAEALKKKIVEKFKSDAQNVQKAASLIAEMIHSKD